jgi:hypothetical protein
MKKLTSVFISSLLLIGTVACSNVAKTSDTAPESTNQTAQPPDVNQAQDIHKENTSDVRRKQLNADIRAREQRNQMAGAKPNRSDDDIKSEVRSKLEANLPDSQLAVDAKDGNVSISGTVPSQPQYQRIEPLAKEIYGVKSVAVNVTVVQAKPKS